VALLHEEEDALSQLRATMAELTSVTRALTAASPFSVVEAANVGSPHSWLRQFFSTSQHASYREQLVQDTTSTNGRPNSLPWATLDLYFADTTNTLLRGLEQAKEFGPRCLSVLRAAVQDLRAPPAVQTVPAQREMTNGDAEDWMVQAARAEAAEAEAEARHAADAEALLGDDLDNVVTGMRKQRERKRAKGKGEAAAE
jgi:hypothetical protein